MTLIPVIFPYEVGQLLTEVFSKQKCTFFEINYITRVVRDSISFHNRQNITKANILNAIAHKAEH